MATGVDMGKIEHWYCALYVIYNFENFLKRSP